MAVNRLFGGGSSPPPDPPTRSASEVAAAELRERRLRASARGRSSTIYAGSLLGGGLTPSGPAGVQRLGGRSLLGG